MSESEEATPGKGKTPISYLQEICTKKGLTPQYDLVANEGAIHEPLFVFKVIAGEITGTGKGPSKKKAKHNAAISALSQLLDCADVNHLASIISNMSSCDQPQSIKPQVLIDAGDNADGNPVGELQEMMQKKMWPPPIYEYTSEQGPPHAREFICTVTLFNFTDQAVGKSKKLAKRNAAVVMLEKVKQGVVIPMENFVANKNEDGYEQCAATNTHQQNSNSPNNNNSMTTTKTKSQSTMTMTATATSTTNNNNNNNNISKHDSSMEKKKTSSMFLTSKNAKLTGALEKLHKLDLNDAVDDGDDDNDDHFFGDGNAGGNIGDSREMVEEKNNGGGDGGLNGERRNDIETKERNHMEVITVPIMGKYKNKWMTELCQLAVEQKFMLTFHEAPFITDKGMYQCILHLSTVPPVVSQGSGTTRYKARVEAIKQSLKNIVTLTKKN